MTKKGEDKAPFEICCIAVESLVDITSGQKRKSMDVAVIGKSLQKVGKKSHLAFPLPRDCCSWWRILCESMGLN